MHFLPLQSLKRLFALLSIITLSFAANARKAPFSHGQAPVSDIDHSGMGTFSGTYSQSFSDHPWFVFNANAGDVISIQVSTPTWNEGSYIWLYRAPDGCVEVGDYTGNGTLQYLMEGGNSDFNNTDGFNYTLTYTIPSNGQYAIQLDSWLGGSGAYTVTLSGTTATTVLCSSSDSDGDGVADGDDCAPQDGTAWQSASLYIDADGDGYTAGQETVCYGATIPGGYSETSLGSDNCDSDPYIYPGATPASVTIPVGGLTVALGSTSTFTYGITGSASDWTWTVTYYDATGNLQSITTLPGGTLAAGSGESIVVTWPTDQPRVYKILATYNGSCTGVDPIEVYVAVYDPNGSFVTGGGWFDSEPGYYVADPEAMGKATFGFVSKYKKGSNVPDGNTEFQFTAGNLLFRSTSYQQGSLVVGGAKATYKGYGTINGAGTYKFMLTAIDGQVTGGGGADKIRMKITDAADNLVYDNQTGITDENADPSTVIGGGSIVIHTPTKGKGTTTVAVAVQEEAFSGKLSITAMPNPSRSLFTLRLQGSVGAALQIRVLDLLGRVVEARNHLGPNSTLTLGSQYRPGVYVVEVVQGTEKQLLRLIKQ